VSERERTSHAPAAVSAEAPAMPLSRVALFGLGDWGPSTASTAVLFFLPFFLTDIARVPPSLAALVILVGGVWDALSVPMVGALSDRTKSRWGRRRPFMLFGAVPFALAFSLLWVVPSWSGWARALYFALAYMLFDTAFACVQVPYASLTPELSSLDRDRTRLNAARAIVSMVGGLLAAALIPASIASFADKPTGYRVTMAFVGALGAVPFLLLFSTVREKSPEKPQEHAHPLADVRDVLRTPAVREAAVIYLVAWVSVSVVASMFEYYITHALGLRGKLDVVLGMVQLSALASVGPIAWASERFGRRATLATGTLFWAAILVLLALLPAERATVGYGLAVLCGPGIAACHVIPWTLIADSVDADEARTSKRREGAVYGVLGFAQKSGVAIAVAGTQSALGKVGYAAGAATQSDAVKGVIRVLFAAVPSVVLVLMGVALLARRSATQR
jgi:GPH family glycoside/pentoside/hexuronide:cation symporter